jgi:hypothetical protein
MRIRKWLVGLMGLFACAGAFADDGGWRFALSPYLWFAGLEGNIGTIPGQPAVPVDISSSEAIEDTEASLMLMLDAMKGRHGFLVDTLYSDVRSDYELLPAPISLELRNITKTTILSAGYQYALHSDGQTALDLMAGIRYWDIDSTLKFRSGLGELGGRTISNTESWVDPWIGFKGTRPIGQSAFYVRGGAVIGGFGLGSDLFYDLTATVGYQWNEAIGTGFGYRLFDVDYEDDGYIYDVTQEGWILALTWTF